ncbi:MAG: hypothetical protein ACREP9_03030 [Candidatus Dormibacteraceae bacterium]
MIEGSIALDPGKQPSNGVIAINDASIHATFALVPAYKHKDPPVLVLWLIPRESARLLSMDSDLGTPPFKARKVEIQVQSFTAEGALIHFQARWPGGPVNQILALDIMRHGDRLFRIYGNLDVQ